MCRTLFPLLTMGSRDLPCGNTNNSCMCAGLAEVSQQSAERPLSLAIIGRPNVGKSTLVNQFLGESRVLTSPVYEPSCCD